MKISKKQKLLIILYTKKISKLAIFIGLTFFIIETWVAAKEKCPTSFWWIDLIVLMGVEFIFMKWIFNLDLFNEEKIKIELEDINNEFKN